MEHWLIADITFLDVHLQLCMLLVTGIMSLWFVYVWATGSECAHSDTLSAESQPSPQYNCLPLAARTPTHSHGHQLGKGNKTAD
jgi:hypothetical protein